MRNKTIVLLLTLQFLQAQTTDDNNATTVSALKLFDVNNDKKISYTEASETLQEHFCQYDVDQSGYLAGQEIKEISPKYLKK